MKIFTCNRFTGHYPVGAAAVVLANNAQEAAAKLNHELKTNYSLTGDAKAEDMIEFPAKPEESVRVLVDGDY